MSLYGYILSIEIIIVVCVLFVHASVINSDVEDRMYSSYALRSYPFSIANTNGTIILFDSNHFTHNNVSFGIGHQIESFLDFFF